MRQHGRRLALDYLAPWGSAATSGEPTWRRGHASRSCCGAALVLCDRDLFPGSWKEILHGIKRMSNPPLLVVTSRLADEQLWAEALNLGAYDVLAKPFEVTEVNRVLSLAWLHWRRMHERLQPLNALATAS